MYTYFSNFPIIEYDNVSVRDITRHVALSNNLRRIPYAFYPYELNNEMRSDILSYAYYNDPDTDWLIYLTNGIVDPYYGWYLTNDQFDSYVTTKFGSIEEAQQRVVYWRCNWSNSDFNTSIEYYNSLPEDLKKYWVPNYGAKNKIISYSRRQEDWTTNTNQIWTLDISMDNANTSFVKEDLVKILVNDNEAGTAECVSANSSSMKIQHIYQPNIYEISVSTNGLSDTISIGGNSRSFTNIHTTVYFDDTIQIMSRSNNSIIATASSISSLIANIPLTEQAYWEPVYYYDYEKEINESKKIVLLLDASYLNDAVNEFYKQIQE